MNTRGMVRKGRRVTAKAVRLGKRVAGKFGPSIVRGEAPKAVQAMPASGDVAGMAVIVTGSTRGVGRAIAEAFAAAGAQVTVNGRSGAVGVAAQIPGAMGIEADAATPEGAARLVSETVKARGRLDLVVNNAGIAPATNTPFWEVGEEDLAKALAVNAAGPFLVAREAVRHWTAAGSGGRILNVSSGVGEQGFAGTSAYGVSKFALEGLTAHAAEDLGPRGIAVASVKLGSLRTEMTRAAFAWEDYELLPGPETVAPVFVELAKIPTEVLNGRSFTAPRLMADLRAELIAPGPLSTYPTIQYPVLERHGQQIERDWQAVSLLDRAENQVGPSPKVAEAVQRMLTAHPTNYYPDEHYTRLRAALSREHGLAPECFNLGNGSWVVLDEILRAFAGPGDEVVSNMPGWFGFHALCPKYGVTNRRVPMRLDAGVNVDRHNLEGIAAQIGPKTRLIYLVSPSNPEGIPLREADFAAFMEKVPPHVPVLVDEAYAEYADMPDLVRTAEWTKREDRVVIGLRTFSKFYALAGMRVGYSFSRPDIARFLAKQSFIFCVNTMAAEAAVAAMEDTQHRETVLRTFAAERRRITESVRAMGLEAVESEGPFLMVESPCAMETYKRAFSDEGLMLPFYEFYDGDYVMFPVSLPEQNDRALAILERLAKG